MGYNLTRIFVIHVDLCVIRIMKSRRRWWVGHIGRVRYAYRILLGKFLEKRQFEHHESHGKITLILILGGNILWESVMDWTDSGWCPKAGFGIRGECCLLDGQFNAHEQLRSLIRTVHIFITNLSFIFYDNWTFIICNLYDLSICVQKGIKLGVSTQSSTHTVFKNVRGWSKRVASQMCEVLRVMAAVCPHDDGTERRQGVLTTFGNTFMLKWPCHACKPV